MTTSTIKFNDATTMVAGKPYLIKPTEDATELVFKGVTIKNVEDVNRMVGNYYNMCGVFGKYEMNTNGTELFLKTDGKFYFTEINLRNDGAESFVTKYGANLPLNHIEDLLGEPLTVQTEEHPGYYIWDMHHLKSLLSRDISIFTWIKEIQMSKGFLMYFKEDKKPFFRQYIYMLEKAIRCKRTIKY